MKGPRFCSRPELQHLHGRALAACALFTAEPCACATLFLQASLRQVEARAEELKAAAQGHEERAREATAEVVKANTIIEKLSVGAAAAYIVG